MTQELWLSVGQAARELSVSERTIRRWLTDGRLAGRREERGNLKAVWRVSSDSVRRIAADVTQRTGSTDFAHGQPTATPSDEVRALLDEVRSLREENAAYREHLERLTLAVQEMSIALKRVLPEPVAPEPVEPEKEKRPGTWWHRLWRWE